MVRICEVFKDLVYVIIIYFVVFLFFLLGIMIDGEKIGKFKIWDWYVLWWSGSMRWCFKVNEGWGGL